MLTENLIKRTKLLSDRIETLAKISEKSNCLTRTYGSNALRTVTKLVEEWMLDVGLETRIDNIGNIRGRLSATKPTNDVFVIGSHLDTVKDAGKFDGALGFLLALSMVEELIEKNTYLPFNIDIVGFCDEEGVRFTTTYLGSSVLSNTFEEAWLSREDEQGVRLGELIKANGGDCTQILSDGYHTENCLGFYEVHIEQGPVLENEALSVGIVTSIAGQTRVEVKFKGKVGHAGTTPIYLRKDALCAAADFVTLVENYAKNAKGTVIATVGKFLTSPNVSNVIPGDVLCSLDLRSPDNQKMNEGLEALRLKTLALCKERGITLSWDVLQQNESVTCDEQLSALLEKAVGKKNKVLKLASGAGHDAVMLSKVMPVSMLFVQCKDGLSHHPDEFVEFNDMCIALDVSDTFMDVFLADYQEKKKLEEMVSSVDWAE